MTEKIAFPRTRLRRSRCSAWSRAMVRENILTPADLIWPLFIADGEKVEEPIESLPGVALVRGPDRRTRERGT